MSTKRKPGRQQRKVGRPRKAPGEPVDHRLTPKMRVAIESIVQNNATREEAAKLAGLTADAIYRARQPATTCRRCLALRS